MSTRSFTLGEANALLPTLEAVFKRLESELRSLRSTRDHIAVLDALWGPAVERVGNPDHAELLRHQADLESRAHRVDRLIEREVLARGVRFPNGGLEHGLLDFPARLDGRWVFLCWRRGEPEVGHWHEVDGGFAGRRPIGPIERAALNEPPEEDLGAGPGA